MASKRKRGRSWYARVFWYENGRKKETQIPLKTANEAVAMERLATVERHEIDIKKGLNSSSNGCLIVVLFNSRGLN